MVRPAPAAAACGAPARDPDDSRVHVAAAADATAARLNAPPAMRAMALDRADGIVRCRGKGTFPYFAYHAICFTPDSNCHTNVAGICAWDVARVRAPGSLVVAIPQAGCCRESTLPDVNAIGDR
jgi:hypothetical protein